MTLYIAGLILAAEVLLLFWLCRRTYFLVSHMTALEDWDPGFNKNMQILTGKLILQLIYIIVLLAIILTSLELVWRLILH